MPWGWLGADSFHAVGVSVRRGRLDGRGQCICLRLSVLLGSRPVFHGGLMHDVNGLCEGIVNLKRVIDVYFQHARGFQN